MFLGEFWGGGVLGEGIMKRGPKPVPKAAKRRRGTFRADRDGGTPEPKSEKPRRPAWLGKEASRHWTAIAAELEGMGVLARADQVALALLCQALADYLAARQEVAEQGMTFLTESGYVTQHPAVGMMNRAWERVVKLAREFGMTPSSRAGLKVPGKEAPADPLLEMIMKRYGSCPN